MKIKKFDEKSREKNPNVPSFLHKNITDMKRSSFEFYNTDSG